MVDFLKVCVAALTMLVGIGYVACVVSLPVVGFFAGIKYLIS